MRNFLMAALTVSFFSCSNEPQVVKTRTLSEFATKIESGEILKSEIIKKYSIGNYPNGSQKYFAALIGYEGLNSDTSTYELSEPNEVKKTDNKSFVYNTNEELLGVFLEKGDTTFFYNGKDLESLKSYTVFDSKKRMISEWESLMNIKRSYTQAKYDKNGNCIYAIVKIEYEPSDLDKRLYSEMEIARKKVETEKTIIYEVELDYY